MKKFTIMAAVAAAALMAVPAVANAQWYAGAAYTHYDLDGADVGGATGRLGYRFNPNFAVEGEGSFGVNDDQGVELNHALGAYAVGIIPFGSSGFSAHGRVGDATAEIGTPLGDVDDDGLSYGAGLGWNVTNSIGIRADYTRFEGDNDADAVSLGASFNF
ncbi:MAG: outer membrane beta-barrel protein [Hyphomonadaceae bacterium]|nr:outer membrane beta-barrel protein [Hyphomonadaceae bacterium]